MVIKGLGTEARWYEARGDRPATDIDILIRKTSGEQVAEVPGSGPAGRIGHDDLDSWIASGGIRQGSVKRARKSR